MRKALIALAATATIAMSVAAPSTADARCRGCVVGGVVGGLAVGALIGSALAGPRYAPAPVYVQPAPVYGPPPVEYYDEPVCRLERHRVWIDGVGYRTRRVEVCD